MQIAAKKLVIFDYSGTLSSEAPTFGEADSLARALQESGLAAVGVTDAEMFWKEIVFPTWEEGSRTTIGYGRVIADRLASLHLSSGMEPQGAASYCPNELSRSTVLEAANSFVTMYLHHSRMDTRWRPLLEKLNSDAHITVVIATDHYAEATDMIIRYLGDWNIAATRAPSATGENFSAEARRNMAAAEQAAPFPDPDSSAASLPQDGTSAFADAEGRCNPFIVANSADLGFRKAENSFWEHLKLSLPGKFETVIMVDDFGFNEPDANGYGKLADVRTRRQQTKAALREVFLTNILTVSFFLDKSKENHIAVVSRKIRDTARRIAAAL